MIGKIMKKKNVSNDMPELSGAHDHQICIVDALDKAADLCADGGARLTQIRRRVLELVWSSHRPIGAYSLLEILKEERENAAPPTIYRALDFLLEQGLIHRIESQNAFIGCPNPDPNDRHNGMFLICTDCGNAVELEESKIERLLRESASSQGFVIKSRTVEAAGLCVQCQTN
jgi:Fur family transcriptional regulator, zinc uptake regulator